MTKVPTDVQNAMTAQMDRATQIAVAIIRNKKETDVKKAIAIYKDTVEELRRQKL